jgi:hypothetical protein
MMPNNASLVLSAEQAGMVVEVLDEALTFARSAKG